MKCSPTYQQRVKNLEDTQQATTEALATLRQERDQATAAAERAAGELAKNKPGQNSELYQKAKRLYLAGKSEEALKLIFSIEPGQTGLSSEPISSSTISRPSDHTPALIDIRNVGVLAVSFYLLLLFAMYGIVPTTFAALHEWVANSGIPFSEKIAKLVAPLLDTPHCLNAVVRRYQERARHLFDDTSEVKHRPKWVPAPLLIDDELLYDYRRPPTLPSQKPYVAGLLELQERLGVGSKHFSEQRWTISIEGPGGIGKSSLAIQFARWASDSRPDYRLAPFPMLPVLVESLGRSADKLKTIDEAAKESVQFIMEPAKVSAPLMEALLRRKRVLVVVDGISEMPREVADGAIRPERGAANARALVVTSRLPTHLSNSLVLRPQGLTLDFFEDRVLDELIAANVGPGRFTRDQRQKLRSRIENLMEEARDGSEEHQVPMIFLKLMVDRADSLVKNGKQLEELPTTLSELVTEYTEQLLRNEQNVALAVEQARMAAHVCMGKERSPKARSEARYAAAGVSRERLDRFVAAGLMTAFGEKSYPLYKFALDSIAEQLDANRLVIEILEGRAEQTELQELIQGWKQLPEDFVGALRRAATRYRQEISATHSIIALNLWPQEEMTRTPTDAITSPLRDMSAAPLGAPAKVFISYSHDSSEHEERALAFAQRLRLDGVDAWIDKYENGTPAEGWPRWMLNRLDWATFVLLICTETYYRRFRGHDEPGYRQRR